MLVGRVGMFEQGDNCQLGEINNGFTESIPTFKHFSFEKYGSDIVP